MSGKRRFKKIEPRFWRDEKIAALDPESKLLALYALTAQVNRLGLFVLSPSLAAEEIGIPIDTLRHRLDTVCNTLSWRFDEATRTLLIPSWWRTNRPENPSALKGYLDDLLELPDTPLIGEWLQCAKCLGDKSMEIIEEAVHDRFGERRGHRVPHGVGQGVPHGVPHPVPHQEKEKEKEKESIPSRGGGASADAETPREEEVASKPKGRRKRTKPKPKPPADDGPKAPTAQWVDRWRDGLDRVGAEVPPDRAEIGQLLQCLAKLWTGWTRGSAKQKPVHPDQATERINQLIDHWFDSDLGASKGYSIKFFAGSGVLNQLTGEIRAKAEGQPASGKTDLRLSYSEERAERQAEYLIEHRDPIDLFLEPAPVGRIETQDERTERYRKARLRMAVESSLAAQRGGTPRLPNPQMGIAQ